jgi:Ca2+/Na+ antiporter
MKRIFKHLAVGAIIGGLLPAIFHPLGITVLTSMEDVSAHAIGVIIGVIVSLIIFKIKVQKEAES